MCSIFVGFYAGVDRVIIHLHLHRDYKMVDKNIAYKEPNWKFHVRKTFKPIIAWVLKLLLAQWLPGP